MAACPSCGREAPEGARFCPACGAAIVAAPAEERKVATVLFADLVGSTALAASQDPERTRVTLERFYAAMAAEVERAGGTVEKFAGDAVMAVFGVPAAHEDDAERALHVALAMLRKLRELFGEDLQLRIGVNTGDIVVGGGREGRSFVTGDAVNVAARLEQGASPAEILVGERTVHAVRGAFEFGEPMRIDAKGKPGGVQCRRLLRALTLMRPRGVGALRQAFVGREHELELLQATYRRAVAEREPHLVTIMGDAGVGKTRLVRELWQWLETAPDEPLRRTGRCLAYGQGITYWPLAEVLKEHLGLLESDPPEAVRSRLGGREILGLTLGLDVAGELHPLAARDRLHDAWVDFVTELAADRPLVLLIEDLHWAEPPLLDLLEQLLRDVRGAALILATARPELLDRRPTWGGGRRNTSVLWLEPLTPAKAHELIEALLAAELPRHFRQVVVERAEGNPFFVEELTATLIDRGILARADGGWTVSEMPADFVVPDSIHAVLAARIDLLAPREKAALQAASVIGRVFWAGPVCDLVGQDGEPDFALLEERDFIRRRAGSAMAGEREFAIKHALTREVAYGTLPKARRAQMHARFAAWLERLEAKDELAPLLAHHYAEAVRPEDADLAWAGAEAELSQLREQAVEWLQRAGELAVARYELDDGLALLHRALDLVEDAGPRSALWRKIGLANALKFDGEAFWTAMQESLAICPDRATCADSYSLLAFQTSIRSGMWPRRPEAALVDGWIDRAFELSEEHSHARARALIARAFWHPETASSEAREGSALADELADPELRSYAWAARASVALHERRFDEALEWAQRRFELEPEITDPDHLTEIRETAVPVLAAIGRFDEARRLVHEHGALARTLTPHHRMHTVALLVETEELAGNWHEICAVTSDVERAARDNTATPCIRNPRSLLTCAAAQMFAGDAAASDELERLAGEFPAEGHTALEAPRVWLAIARGDRGELGDVLEEFAQHRITFGVQQVAARLTAFTIRRDRERIESEAPRYVDARTCLEPFALRALGFARGDRALIERASARFVELGLHWHKAQTDELVDEA